MRTLVGIAGATALSLVLSVEAGLAGEYDPAIDAITVVGQVSDIKDVPGSVDFLDPEILQEQSYGDITRVLRRTTGVYIQEEDGFGLRPNIGMRGSGLDRSAKIALMEDGVLVAPAPYAAPSAYYFPNQARISAVEVSKGPAAIKYGPNTVGGALNLLSTPIPEEKAVVLRGDIGSFDQRRIHASAGTVLEHENGSDVGLLVETLQDETSGFKELDNGGDTGYRLSDTLGKLRLRGGAFGFMHTLEFSASYAEQNSNETYLGLTDADFAMNPYRRYNGSQVDEMDWERIGYRVGHTVELHPDVQLATVYYANDFQRNWYKLDKVGGKSISSILGDPTANAAEFADIIGAAGHVSADDALSVKANNREYYSQGVQTVLTVERELHGMNHRLQASARWHEDEMDRFQWADGYRMDNGTLVRTSFGVPGTDSNRIDSAKAWAFFVQDEITYGAWTLVPGVRLEQIETRREDYGKADPSRTGVALKVTENEVNIWIPGIGILFEASDQLTLLAGANKGFTPPAPGKTADAEEAWNYEAGARLFLDNGVSAEAIGFWSDYENLVATCTASTGGGCTIGDQFNGDAVTVLGVEAKLSGELSNFIEAPVLLPFWASYTYTDATFDSAFKSSFEGWGDVMKGDELPYIPKHQVSAGLGVEGEVWAVHGVVSYVDDVRAIAGQGVIPVDERIASHTVFDLAGELALTDNVALTGSVQNVFDSDYAVARRPAGLRPGKPQSFRIGFKADL